METHDVVCTLCSTAFQTGAFGEAECPGCGLLHIWCESYGPSDEAIKTALAPRFCKTCTWWTGGVHEHYGQHGFCEHPKTHTDNPDSLSTDGHANAITGPDFGCVHHEEKP